MIRHSWLRYLGLCGGLAVVAAIFGCSGAPASNGLAPGGGSDAGGTSARPVLTLKGGAQ